MNRLASRFGAVNLVRRDLPLLSSRRWEGGPPISAFRRS